MASVPIDKIEANDKFLIDLVIDCSCERFPRKKRDWVRLGKAISANSNIQSLSLVFHPNAAYDQEIRAGIGIAVMARYMAKNRCIDSLSIRNLVYTSNTTSGDVFFMYLSKFIRDNHSLVNLELAELSTGQNFHYHMLAKGILESKSIKELSIKNTRLGYSSFGIMAQACKSSLEKLSLNNADVNLSRLQLLVGSWAMDKNTPKRLDLSHNDYIGMESCAELSVLPIYPKHIILNSCPIGDGGVVALLPRSSIRAGQKICRIKTLTLRNTGIGFSACERLSTVLACSDSRIEYLDLAENNLCDQCILALVCSLVGNKGLRRLNLMWNPRLTSDIVWDAFSGILGQGATVYELGVSNHTLTNVYARSQNSPLGLQVKTLLYMNAVSPNPVHVRREKIKRLHLMNAYGRCGLLSEDRDINSIILPDILGWINNGSECAVSSLGAIFYLTKHNPWVVKGTKKRTTCANRKQVGFSQFCLPEDQPFHGDFPGYWTRSAAKRMRV